jgi:hypothetical protein
MALPERSPLVTRRLSQVELDLLAILVVAIDLIAIPVDLELLDLAAPRPRDPAPVDVSYQDAILNMNYLFT